MRCGLKVIKDSIVEDLPALPETKLLNPPDEARSASSSLHNDKSGYRYFTSMLDSREGWLAGTNAPGQYLTIDAGEVRPISAVVTQRRRGHNEMVTKFKVLTSEKADGPFTYVADGATYIGTTYLEGEEKGEAVFPEPISARFVRIEAVSFQTRVTLRAGLKVAVKNSDASDAPQVKYSYEYIGEGKCEDYGMTAIADKEECRIAGAAVDGHPDKPIREDAKIKDRPGGCLIHKFQRGSATKPTEWFPSGQQACTARGENYDCICKKPASVADAVRARIAARKNKN
jgi:hypothetical protein